MEENENLDNLIIGFGGTLDKEWQFVNEYPWETKDDPRMRKKFYATHYDITNNRLLNAEKIVKAAVAEGKGSRKDVGKVSREAKKFFEYFKQTCESYISSSNYSDLVESAENISEEINFQNEIYHNLLKLQTRAKSMGDSTKASKVNVVLYNDVSIPILLREIAEEEFPEIVSFLKEREDTENSGTEA